MRVNCLPLDLIFIEHMVFCGCVVFCRYVITCFGVCKCCAKGLCFTLPPFPTHTHTHTRAAGPDSLIYVKEDLIIPQVPA